MDQFFVLLEIEISIEKTILFFSQPADPSRVVDFEKFRKNLMKIVEGICFLPKKRTELKKVIVTFNLART